MVPLDEKINETNRKIEEATKHAEIALKFIQDCGLDQFDTEQVASSLKTISGAKAQLEKAETDKLNSIQMNFRMQQEEVIEYIQRSFDALKADMLVPYFSQARVWEVATDYQDRNAETEHVKWEASKGYVNKIKFNKDQNNGMGCNKFKVATSKD